ncbi:MAG: ABC transporter permease [Nitrososphaeraceae archaeon]
MRSSIISLVYRNIIAAVDKVFLIWQIIFPIVYIFIAGFAYDSLISRDDIIIGNSFTSYTTYLALGMIGFNIMNSSTVSGSIIWNDRRNGMFQQILTMPFTRLQYTIGNILTIMLIGISSAFIIFLIGIPIIFDQVIVTAITIPYLIFALIIGSIFFGSVAIIIASNLRSNEGFNVIVNGVFLFFAFASSTFYPNHGIPEPLQMIFYVNPLTHVVDIIREAMFSEINYLTNIRVIILSFITTIAFSFAIKSINKIKI